MIFYHVLPCFTHITHFLLFGQVFPSFSMIFHHFPSFSVQRSGPWSLNCQATRRRRWRNSWWSPCRLACWICGGFWCQTGVAISNHKKKQGSTEQSTTIWYNLLYLIYSIIYYNLPESTIISIGFFYFFDSSVATHWDFTGDFSQEQRSGERPSAAQWGGSATEPWTKLVGSKAMVPSDKLTIAMGNHHFQWENPL